MKRNIPYLIGMGELQRHAADIIRRLHSRHKEGFVVSHNEPQAVLMSLNRYEQLTAHEEARKKEEDEVLAIIQESDEAYRQGKTKILKSLKDL